MNKERPILFNAEMVMAILARRKTQTRQIIKQEIKDLGNGKFSFERGGLLYTTSSHRTASGTAWAHLLQFCPFGKIGDRLWVRETFSFVGTCDPCLIVYKANYPNCVPREYENIPESKEIRWTPSSRMPRDASRITLEITGVSVERLNDISRGDCMSEGCPFPNMAAGDNPKDWYRALWESINGDGSWDLNPWVRVVKFKVLEVKP